MGMGITGILWVPWDSHEIGTEMLMWMGMNVMGMGLAFSQWHSHCHNFNSDFQFLCT